MVGVWRSRYVLVHIQVGSREVERPCKERGGTYAEDGLFNNALGVSVCDAPCGGGQLGMLGD